MNDNEHGTPDETPWGPKQHEAEILAGIVRVSTATHGGVYIGPDLRREIPDQLKIYSNGGDGAWWEEDEAQHLPLFCLSYRNIIEDEDLREYFLFSSESHVRDDFPDEWELITGRKLKPGESLQRDEETLFTETSETLIVAAIEGHPQHPQGHYHHPQNAWVPENMIGVAAYPGKAFHATNDDPAPTEKARYFLVPITEFRRWHFVIDPARHQEVTGQPGVPPAEPTPATDITKTSTIDQIINRARERVEKPKTRERASRKRDRAR
jgi:hypothetical protein